MYHHLLGSNLMNNTTKPNTQACFRGECLKQDGINSYFSSSCCSPVKCPSPYCQITAPQWVLDCHKGYCQTCAIALYSVKNI